MRPSGRGPRDNLIFVDGLPFDKVVHFDQTLGEEEDIGGGGRFSIFAPNSIQGAEFSPGGWSAAYSGRSGSLLQLDVVGGSPTPSASLRIDIAGFELGYDGPSGFHDDTTLFLTARSFDFGRVFDMIDEIADLQDREGRVVLQEPHLGEGPTSPTLERAELLLHARRHRRGRRRRRRGRRKCALSPGEEGLGRGCRARRESGADVGFHLACGWPAATF